MDEKIDDWKKLTNKITEDWIKEYFELEKAEEIVVDWVAEDVGSIFEFADMFISFQDILSCYKHKISADKFHEWYWYCLEEQFIHISLAKFILSPEERIKKEEESLEKTKQNAIFAEKLLKEGLEKQENKKQR